MEAIDRARFPTAEEVRNELRDAGFPDVRLVHLDQQATLTRDEALERIHGKHISTFDLISDEEYKAGLERAEREVPARVDYQIDLLIALAQVS
jgi:hypothetical protein